MVSLGGEADVDVGPDGSELLQPGAQVGSAQRLPQVVIGAELALVVGAVRELGRGVGREPRVGGLTEVDAVEAREPPRGRERPGRWRSPAAGVPGAISACTRASAASGWQLVRFGVRDPGGR